ncbi:hypothetical protein HDU85_005646 [Gaertneriomyces sp. JEL0708]|nr:hypothetical protein HDU85_005646 [Gaertneriomyces sp. JEL0708]
MSEPSESAFTTPIHGHLPHTTKEVLVDFASGIVGGCAGVLAGHPLDTIKVRLQSQIGGAPSVAHGTAAVSSTYYKGPVDCAVKIVKGEGVRGLYKGMVSPLVGVAVVNSLLFGVYGSALRHISGSSDSNDIKSIFFAGCVSGSVNALLSCPMELVKIRLQTATNASPTPSSSRSSHSLVNLITHLYRTNGLRAFYRGLGVTIWRETPSYGAYFASYELLCRYFSVNGDVEQNFSSPDGKNEGMLGQTGGLLMAGGIAGVIAWMSTYPLDVIKTRIQSSTSTSKESRSVRYHLKSILRNEGWKTLWAGWATTCVRAFPTNAATFWGVWCVRELFKDDGRS